MITTHQKQNPSCPGGDGSGGEGGGCRGEKLLPYAPVANVIKEVVHQEAEVDEVKMEAEDHLAREYVQEFVLDHLDPADVKREVNNTSTLSISKICLNFFKDINCFFAFFENWQKYIIRQ